MSAADDQKQYYTATQNYNPRQELLAAIVESSQDAVIVSDLTGIITFWNKGAENLFGYTASEMVGSTSRVLIPSYRDGEAEKLLQQIAQGAKIENFETQRRSKDGLDIDVSVSASALRDADGVIIGAARILRDITKQKQNEAEISRLSRLYSAISHVNQAIIRLPDKDELFKKSCEIMVKDGGLKMAWIGWHDADRHVLVPVAAYGDVDGYIESLHISTDAKSENLGPTATCFLSGNNYICDDIFADPITIPWRAEMQRCGFKASAAFPLFREGKACGTLSVYADRVPFFHDREIALLKEVAADISFAIDNHTREELRKKTEIKVRNERDFSSSVISSVPGVLYLYDHNGRFLRWNENFRIETGYSDLEIASMHPLDFFPESEKKMVAARIAEVFDKGESFVEAHLMAKDGRLIPYYFTGTLTNTDGADCLVGVGIDITERKQAEEEKDKLQRSYRMLFEYAPDGILIATRDGYYLDANPSMCDMLGYAREEIIGLHSSRVVAESEVHNIESALDTINADAEHQREWTFRRKDGTDFYVEVTAAQMPDMNIMATVRDLTDRKNAEIEREKFLRAEASDRIKSAFLATMSHELRTPLNSIIGFTGIILQGLPGPLNTEQTKQLEMVRGSARHLLALINDVLDISKIEAGQFIVAQESFDIAEAVRKAVGIVKPMAEKKSLQIGATIDESLGTLVSDPARFQQILLNLLSNAIKFTDTGSVSLTAVPFAAFIPEGHTNPAAAVKISVTDTGIGIRREDMDILFQPFRQIESKLSRKHEGTGLGLAISRKLANLMGGDIEAYSVWGAGSTFSIILPLNRAAQ